MAVLRLDEKDLEALDRVLEFFIELATEGADQDDLLAIEQIWRIRRLVIDARNMAARNLEGGQRENIGQGAARAYGGDGCDPGG